MATQSSALKQMPKASHWCIASMGNTPLGTIMTNTRLDKVLEEVDPVFDLGANVYYIAIDNGNDVIYSGELLVGGVGSSWTKRGGFGMVSIGADFVTVAHELGHAFNLSHDFRDDTYVMSYGYIPDWLSTNQRLSACNAEFLAVHTYFNPKSPIEDGSPPTIEEDTSSPIHISSGYNKHPCPNQGPGSRWVTSSNPVHSNTSAAFCRGIS